MEFIEKKIQKFIEQNSIELLVHRRWFHQHPETSFKEFKTSKYIQDYLKKIGVFTIDVVANTGVVCEIGEGEYINACRFNMDGLPIHEETDLAFCSLLSGYSHSCGHDFELAWGVMIAKYFQENPPKGKIKLIFQPAEEGHGDEAHGKTGGQLLAEFGVFDVGSVMSLHLEPEEPINSVCIQDGEVTCSAYDFEFIIEGVSCHAAKPQQGVNPVYYAGKIINDIYELEKDIRINIKDDEGFVLITVSKVSTQLQSDRLDIEETINTIPQFAVIKGISRIRSSSVAKKLVDGLNAIANKYPELISCKLNLKKVAVATVNDKNIVKNVIETARNFDFTIKAKRTTWRDDAGWASEKAPSAHGFIGIYEGKTIKLHSSDFNANEDALFTGLKIFLGTLERNFNNFDTFERKYKNQDKYEIAQ